MPISQSPILTILSHAFATLFVGFGINAMIRPANALTFFEWHPPIQTADLKVLEGLLAVYGVRDIFMGFALYAEGTWGTKKSLGWTLMAASAVAFADGYICFIHGKGQMNHWGYAPMLTAVGALLAGLFD